MSEPLAFGLVGAGGIAQAYAAALRKTGVARLVAVADTRPEAAASLAESVGGRAFASHAEMVRVAKPAAVIVCTPPNTHADLTCELLEQGLHVLCEKPFAIDPAGARRMAETARRRGVLLTMGSKFRYVDDVIRAKSIVASGILGEIILFENAFTARVDMTRRWNSDPAISGGGVLVDNGSHSVDLVRYFLGPIEEVQAVEGRRVQRLAVEDTVRVFIRTKGGVMSTIDLSWSLNKELENYLEIYGSNGTIKVGWKQSKYRQSSSSEWSVFGSGYDKVEAFKRQVENFARAIGGSEPLLIQAEDAVASVETVAAAYESMRRNAWTPVGARA